MIALALWLQDIVIQGKDLPYTGKFEAPSAGYLILKKIEGPDALSMVVDFPDLAAGTHNIASGEARVPAGTIRYTVRDVYGTKIDGTLKLNLTFAAETDSTERNDDAAHARPIALGSIEVVLMPRGEVDVLSLDLPGPGYVICTRDSPSSDLNLKVELFDDVGRSRGLGGARFDVPGRVTLAVSDLYGAYSSLSPFKVKVEFFEEVDVLEPNDAPDHAVPLALDEWVDVAVAPWTDVDHFRVTAPADGWLYPEAPTANVNLRWTCINGPSGPPFLVKAGDHVLAMSTLYGDQWNLETFPIRFRFAAAAADALEPNDDKPVAVELDTVYTVMLPTPSDVDRFEIKGGKPGFVTMETVGPAPVPCEFFAEVGGNAVIGAALRLRYDGRPMPVGLRVQSYGNGLPAPFHIRAAWSPDPDAAEPNDTRESARPIALGEAVELALDLPFDADWFSFKLPGPGHLYALLHTGYEAFFHDGVEVTLDVFDDAGKHVAVMPQSLLQLNRTLRIERAGSYFIRVTRSNGASADPFHLTAEFLPDGDPGLKVDSGPVAVYYLGVELDTSGSTALKLIARGSRGAFVSADRAEEITARLEDVMTAVAKESPSTKPPPASRVGAADSSSWIGVIVGAFALIAFVALRRSRVA